MGAGGQLAAVRALRRDARPGRGWWGSRRRNRPRLDLGPFGDATVIRASAPVLPTEPVTSLRLRFPCTTAHM